MKRFTSAILFVVCMAFSLTVSAQLAEEQQRILKYIHNAMNYNRTVPQEKVYMHFDNMGYFEDETIWFKAYVTRTDIQRPTDLSKVLYVELLNPTGDVIKTKKYPIDEHGEAYGDMKLDTLFGTGFYEVRAYTRYMTNWGVNACFSRVFPIFKAPKEEGKFSSLVIDTKLYKSRDPNERKSEDALYDKAIADGIHSNDLNKTISVQFYPEGGNLIRGKKSRVAMLAVDDNGKPYSSTGFVQNSNGDVVANVTTDSLGRGSFEVVAEGELTMQMKNLKGKVQTFNLPAAKEQGCVLTLDAISDDMLVTMQFSDAILGHVIGFTTVNNGNVTYCDTIEALPVVELELDRAIQKPGVNQFTVFDSNGRILAERLYFIYPEPTAADSIIFKPTNSRLKPCGPVELNVQTQPNSSFSFSAVDAGTMTNGRQGNMKTWMLLSSEVKGYIHNVDYYFESDDKEHRKSADLLMLTQGWRRYDWEMMEGLKQFQKIQPIEDKFYLFGKLREYRKKNPVNNVNLQAFLFNSNGESLVGETVTDANGNYAFSLPFMDGEWKMQIFTRIADKRKTFYVGIDRQFSPVPRYITPTEASILRPNAANHFLRGAQISSAEPEEEFIPITRRDHVLQNVTVKAKRRYFTNDDWTYKNENFGRRHAAFYYDIDAELDKIRDMGEEDPYLFEFLVNKNHAFYSKNSYTLPKDAGLKSDGPRTDMGLDSLKIRVWDGTLSYNHKPIRWVVDNGETQNTGGKSDDTECAFDEFFPTELSEIKSIYIDPGSSDGDGEVIVYIYTHKRFSTESQKGLRHTYFQGFNKPSTFEMEDYSILPPMADFRRTIYWNPNVKTDSEGKAKVFFYNNSTCEEMYISAEGLTPSGHVLVGK